MNHGITPSFTDADMAISVGTHPRQSMKLVDDEIRSLRSLKLFPFGIAQRELALMENQYLNAEGADASQSSQTSADSAF